MNFTLEQAIKGIDDRNIGFNYYNDDEYAAMEDIIEMNKNIVDDDIIINEQIKNVNEHVKVQNIQPTQPEQNINIYAQSIKEQKDILRALEINLFKDITKEQKNEIRKTIKETKTKIADLTEQEKKFKIQQKQIDKDNKQLQKQIDKDNKDKQKQIDKDNKDKQKQIDKELKTQQKNEQKEKIKELLTDIELAKIYIDINGENIKMITKEPKLVAYTWDEKTKLWKLADKFDISCPIYPTLVKYFENLLSNDDILLPIIKVKLGANKKLLAITNQIYNIIKKDINFEETILNKSMYELPIKNGMLIDLKTLVLRERTINDYFSFGLDVDFLGDNYNLKVVNDFMCDISKKIIIKDDKEILEVDLELVDYHKKLWGYLLSGDIGDRSIHIFQGVGCNGKSSLINIFKNITHKFTTQLSSAAMMNKTNSPLTPELETLMTARVALMPESDKGDELNVKVVKTITGDDTINCRPLYRTNITFKSQAKLILATQFKPDIKNDDKALWDRIKLIPFNSVFEKTLENTAKITKLQTDYLSDFFTYFCYGAKEYFKSGFGKCSIIDEALNDYRSSSNKFLCFIKDTYTYIQKDEYNLLTDNEKTLYRIPRADVYTTFNTWCGIENNKDYKTITRNEFYTEIRKFVDEIKYTGVECFICQYKQKPTINDNNTSIII
jgi:P4 family phage/plasmid primase-like protien